MEQFLNSCVFFIGSSTLRLASLRLLFLSLLFSQSVLSTKIQSHSLPNGTLRKSFHGVIPDFFPVAFLQMIPFSAIPVKQPLREDLKMDQEQVLYI